MRRKILLIPGIVVLFVIAFAGAVFWMLPADAIRHFAEKTIEKQLNQKQGIEIETIRVSPLLNATIKGFRMTPRAVSSSEPALATDGGTFDGFYCAPYVEEQAFVVDSIFVSPKISSLISKKPEGKFKLQIQDGTIEGDIKSIDKKMQITAAGGSISLNEFALLSNFTKTQLYGMLQFDLRAAANAGKLAELVLKMKSVNTAMCPKRIKLNVPGIPFIEFPFTVFGNISADIEIVNDKVIINELTSDGPDIELKVTGDIMLKSGKSSDIRLNLDAEIKPSQQWVEDNGMNVIYQVCEKLDDGSIKLSLRGTTKKIRHDCGTPVPEPAAETPQTGDAADGDIKAEPAPAPKAADKPAPDEEKAKDGGDDSEKPKAGPVRGRAMPVRPSVGEKKNSLN